MEFQEYPKGVYKLDELRIVADAAEEAAAVAEGFGPWVDPADRAPEEAEEAPDEPVKRGPGRPKKAE